MLLIAHDSGLHMVRPPLSGGINTSQIGSHSDFLREADPANSYAPFCMNVTDNSAGGGLCGSVPAVVEVSGDTLNASGAAVFTCTTYPGPFLIDYVDPVTCNGNEADYYGAYSIDYLFKIEADDSDTISCNNVGNATARPDSTKSCLENALDLFL
jgi:hypothetical protein